MDTPKAPVSPYQEPYGNLVELNTSRVIADSIGEDLLRDIVDDYLDLLETSAAVYEKNGDYALGIFASGWCRFMDQTSRRLCDTDDNREALKCGKWHCHESCWQVSRASIDTGKPADLECLGGIRIYAVPVLADGKVIGAMSFGYGDPPQDRHTLQQLAESFSTSIDHLYEHARSYESRTSSLIDIAKSRLRTAARLIGEVVQRKRVEEELARHVKELARSNADLQQFAHVASHDLQEPLRTVASFTHLLVKRYKDKLDSEANELIGAAVDAVARMQRMIDEVLASSRPGAKGAEMKPTPCKSVLEAALANLQSAVQETGAVITHDPLPTVTGDASQLTRLFQNLIGNAINFRSDGPPAIHVGAEGKEKEWLFWVRDSGIGMDPRHARRILRVSQRL
ncbi:MAG: histidine kinase dimerization/phospho-acceptor domain-containing protein, partial [Acidobacteriota bacterium]